MLALRKGRVKGATLPPLSPPPTRTVQQPLPGGTWWTSLGVVKVWSKADKKSDLVVELKKGRVYNVLKTDGDWQQIQTIGMTCTKGGLKTANRNARQQVILRPPQASLWSNKRKKLHRW